MRDICIDFCESIYCQNCKYKDATSKEREDAFYKLVKDDQHQTTNCSQMNSNINL